MFDNFVQTDADKSRDVRNALNSSRQKAVEENLKSLIGNERMTGLALLSIHKDRQIYREKL